MRRVTDSTKHWSSRDNPSLKGLRRLVSDSSGYRRAGQVLLEGPHLCEAWLQAGGGRPLQVLLAESQAGAWGSPFVVPGDAVVTVADALMRELGSLDSPASVAFVVALPRTAEEPLKAEPTIVLDRLQDPGNVGSILRSAAAFGVRQVLALQGTAALWSPKVLRAAQGAHFSLALREGLGVAAMDELEATGLPLLATSSHVGDVLGTGQLPNPCAWLFGHEGQGVDRSLLERARVVRIQQVGQESLNVAAAAAICLHHTSRRS